MTFEYTPEHVILVAFTVQDDDRAKAHDLLMERLPQPYVGNTPITSWWVAEDDRRDGSDCDSAVFVAPGNQRAAVETLHRLRMTPECNLQQGAETRDQWEPEGVDTSALWAALRKCDEAQASGPYPALVDTLTDALGEALSLLTDLGVSK